MEDSPSPKPWTAPEASLTVLVEGVGDLVNIYLGPAFEQLRRNHPTKSICVFFADESSNWTSPEINAKRQGTIKTIQDWGGTFLDKTNPIDRTQYDRLHHDKTAIDVVLIATSPPSHLVLADFWLDHTHQIFVEKPLDTDLPRAQRLSLKIQSDADSRILAFDHYRARFLPTRTQSDLIQVFGESGWEKAEFYFLEDRSGGDPNYRPPKQRNGPIENEQRVETLRLGLIYDLMPHVAAVLQYLGDITTLTPRHARVGRYLGVDHDPTKPTEIDKETFAEVQFTLRSFRPEAFNVTAFVGKGIRGVKALGIESNVKLLVVTARNGRRVRFDLRSSGDGAASGLLLDVDGRTEFAFPLNPHPYTFFLESILAGTYLDGPHALALPFKTGKRILEILTEITNLVPNRDEIPTYPLGINGNPAPYLEDLLDGGSSELPLLNPTIT